MDSTIIFLLAALVVGLAKGGVGGLGGLLAPLLSLTMPVSQAVGLILPLLMVGDVFALRAYWREWDTKHLRLLLPAAVIGIAAGALLLTSLPDAVLRRLLGTITLIVLGYKVASDSLERLAYSPRNWHGYLAGGTAGFSSALANAGGPPITAYLLLQKLRPTTFVGTQTLFFAIVNALKLPIFLTANVIDVDQLLRIAWVALMIPVGVWAGRRLIRWINPRAFDWLMSALLLWAGLALLVG